MKNRPNHRAFLIKRDPQLAGVIRSLDEIVLEQRDKVYLRLCSSILSQQLSVKVARVIYDRFLSLYDFKEPQLEQILETDEETLQSIGFSRPKSRYVHNVCRFFLENDLSDASFYEMDNEGVIRLLTQIKGIGRWTVEMILIFTLARQDVFPLDDLGVRHAMIELYAIKEQDKKLMSEKLLQISSAWAPFRTYATRYLWLWRDAGGL